MLIAYYAIGICQALFLKKVENFQAWELGCPEKPPNLSKNRDQARLKKNQKSRFFLNLTDS
jgi:hypothetical protein